MYQKLKSEQCGCYCSIYLTKRSYVYLTTTEQNEARTRKQEDSKKSQSNEKQTTKNTEAESPSPCKKDTQDLISEINLDIMGPVKGVRK